MANAMSIRMVNDWNSATGRMTVAALNAAKDVMNKSSDKICKTAIWYMAQSAAKITKLSAKTREVVRNPSFRHLVSAQQYKNLNKNGNDGRDYYKWTATKLMPQGKWKPIFANDPKDIRKIKGRGLAQRSWMWGLGRGKGIAGTYEFKTVTSGTGSGKLVGGYILRDKLDYILKALPAGWEKDVESKAINRIMKQAARKLERDFRNQVNARAA